MTGMTFWLIVGTILMIAALALAVTGFIKTKNDGHLEPLLWLIGAAIVLSLGIHVLSNVGDVYAWVYPIYWGLAFVFLPLFLGYISLLLVFATLMAIGTSSNVKIFGTEGAMVTPGTGGRQWDFAISIAVMTLVFVALTLTSVMGTVNECWGAIPRLEQTELKEVISISREIDQLRKEMGMGDSELQKVERNPFAINFPECDITPGEQVHYTAALNAILNPRGYTCTKILGLRHEAPHSRNHTNGYTLVTACVSQGANPAKPAVFRMAEPIGAGGVNDWAQDMFEGKLKVILQTMRALRGSSPSTARQVLADALNGIPVGGGADDLMFVPVR
jgi:hypothetical protein